MTAKYRALSTPMYSSVNSKKTRTIVAMDDDSRLWKGTVQVACKPRRIEKVLPLWAWCVQSVCLWIMSMPHVCAVHRVRLLNKWWRTVTRKNSKVRSKKGQSSVWLHRFPRCVFHRPLVKLYSDSTMCVVVGRRRPLWPRPAHSLIKLYSQQWQHNVHCCQ